MKVLALICVSYIIGSFSSAYLVGKTFKSIDIREHGSGNSGSTNVLRVMGFKAGLLTFILDFSKGIISAYIGYKSLGEIGSLLGGLFSVIGHNWPMFLNFKGGKGVATSLGAYAFINFNIALVGVFLGIFIALGTKYVSLGSLVFLITFPINYLLFKNIFNYDISKYVLIYSIIIAIMGIIRHKSNISRLIKGNESKIKVGGK